MTSLHDTNNMLRAQGFNVPASEDLRPSSAWDHIEEQDVPIMDMRYGPDMGVDTFMSQDVADAYEYAAAMGYDFDA